MLKKNGLLHALNEHKDKVQGPHFIFSAQNPKFPDKDQLGLSHEQVLGHLKGAGFDAHEVNGHYGSPEKSIIVYNTSPEHQEELHGIAAKLGQDSSISSTGKKHEMRFHHGDDAGKKIHGIGTVWHEKKPGDFYTSLPGSAHHFTHNFDFGIAKSERLSSHYLPYVDLLKGEDEETYKKYAKEGMAVMHPVTIKGATHRPDIGIRYHSTIKLFDPSKDSPTQAHEIASKMNFTPISSKHVNIKPVVIEGRGGYKIHAIELSGHHEKELKDNNAKFSHMGYQNNYEFKPHISVDKETWDSIKNAGHKTAHDAGIEFHAPELHLRDKKLASYGKKKDDKLASSENMDNSLQKGALKNLAIGAATAATIAGTNMAPVALNHQPKAGSHNIEATNHINPYSENKILRAIASVESSDGKNTNHKPTSRGTAYGKYALMPDTIRETIHLNPDLKDHKRAVSLDNQSLTRYMQDNPGLDEKLAQKHISRLESHFGKDPHKIAMAWNQGISGTKRAVKQKADIANHWYVEKFKTAYNKGK